MTTYLTTDASETLGNGVAKRCYRANKTEQKKLKNTINKAKSFFLTFTHLKLMIRGYRAGISPKVGDP